MIGQLAQSWFDLGLYMRAQSHVEVTHMGYPWSSRSTMIGELRQSWFEWEPLATPFLFVPGDKTIHWEDPHHSNLQFIPAIERIRTRFIYCYTLRIINEGGVGFVCGLRSWPNRGSS